MSQYSEAITCRVTGSVFVGVVKLANTGDCQSPGLCSNGYIPYGFEITSRAPKVVSVSYRAGDGLEGRNKTGANPNGLPRLNRPCDRLLP